MPVKHAPDFGKEVLVEAIFYDETIRPAVPARLTDFFTMVDRDDNDPNIQEAVPNQPGRAQAVELRHLQVHQDQVWLQIPSSRNTLFPITGKTHEFDFAPAFQQHTNGSDRHRRVINHKRANGLSRIVLQGDIACS